MNQFSAPANAAASSRHRKKIAVRKQDTSMATSKRTIPTLTGRKHGAGANADFENTNFNLENTYERKTYFDGSRSGAQYPDREANSGPAAREAAISYPYGLTRERAWNPTAREGKSACDFVSLRQAWRQAMGAGNVAN
jgi:hypothetical protein